MKSASVFVRRSMAWLVPALLLLPAQARAGDDAGDPVPILVGPVVLAGTQVAFPAASYVVAFGEGGTRAQVALTLHVANAEEVLLGFAGRDVSALAATLDGAPVVPEYTLDPLPAAGGPFESQMLVRLAPAAAGEQVLVVTARCGTIEEQRDPPLGVPQATFILNQTIVGPRARILHLDPGAAATSNLTLRVETLDPQRPEAPVGGAPTATATGTAVEGPVVADPSAPLEITAIEGEYGRARSWGFALGIGLVLDFPHVRRTLSDDDGNMVESWYATSAFKEPQPRMWLSGLFQVAWEHWMLSTGIEGDPLGVLEVPLVFKWFPQDREPGWGWPILDYRFFFGAALQVFNTATPVEHGLDVRPFIRIGAGLRFYVIQAEIFYEVAPPVGDWNGPRGLVEHKLGFTFPFAF